MHERKTSNKTTNKTTKTAAETQNTTQTPSQSQIDKVEAILAQYDKSHQLLNSMIGLGDEIITLGSNTSSKLKQQTERIHHTQKDIDQSHARVKKL
ncbi:hypothetical protein FDP41_002166 [Naegleria fowleri]|uniref:t-SNARE coiled-coil homology domain-containing protein n=1 Tax=Naegleria fowleri TaxID=5763 RepID=A0A6A5BV13_NAEFO|nr:uncharacterized protein FDP41_002166 [Naegleria fowleri]KAF0979096.1 hypothetical protein FDP41_002166 [Naegleria fowleri]